MKGITFTGSRTLDVMNFKDPTPGPREVVLEIKASGMCGTDLGAYRSPTGRVAVGAQRIEGPVIAGHEPCGVVVAVGSAITEKEARIGDRVLDHHYDGCGTCRHCIPAGRRCAWMALSPIAMLATGTRRPAALGQQGTSELLAI